MLNALSIDVEDYFHPTEVQNWIRPDDWNSLPARVTEQTRRVLELLENRNTRGTFFILGWVAERHPQLVREIVERGHEIGCHSYRHKLVYLMTPGEFRQDTQLAIQRIEDACGVRPVIYRAPSYSIIEKCLWALDILVELGFTHDSSIYPINHDRYGIPGFWRFSQLVNTKSGPICEVPISTVRLPNGTITPVGGGAYLRIFPYCYTAAGVRSLNKEQQSACIYFHPWEIDAEQPRLAQGFLSRLRTYSGLHSMASKIDRLIGDFSFSTLTAVHPFDQVAQSAVSCSAEDLESVSLGRKTALPFRSGIQPRACSNSSAD